MGVTDFYHFMVVYKLVPEAWLVMATVTIVTHCLITFLNCFCHGSDSVNSNSQGRTTQRADLDMPAVIFC